MKDSETSGAFFQLQVCGGILGLDICTTAQGFEDYRDCRLVGFGLGVVWQLRNCGFRVSILSSCA